MKSCFKYLFLFFFLPSFSQKNRYKIIDQDATKETKALYTNLEKLSRKHILFGHQHATEYGHGWVADSNRSDVKSVTGSHPAVIGVDFIGLSGRPDSIIEKIKTCLEKILLILITVEESLLFHGIFPIRFRAEVFIGGIPFQNLQ